jgi:uncharacterized protein
MAEFVLQLQDIDDAGKDYEFGISPEWLDEALSGTPLQRDPAQGPGRLRVHAQRNGSEILVKGDVEAKLLVECGRCLGDTALHVHTEMTALLTSGDADGLPQELELTAEDLDRARFTGHEVVLDELVREHLLLECPMQPLCSETCPGIPIPERLRGKPEDFGGDGTIDPRLMPLKQLRAKLSDDKE